MLSAALQDPEESEPEASAATRYAVARIEHSDVEREAGRLQILLDRLEGRRQLGSRREQRDEDRHAGRAHAPILVFAKIRMVRAVAASTSRMYNTVPR